MASTPGPPKDRVRDYWVTACVYLHHPLIDQDGSNDVVVGYYRNFAVHAAPQRIKAVIDAAVRETEVSGDVAWNESEWYVVDRESLDETILARAVPLHGEGIWYMSGRMFFYAEQN